MMKVFLQRTGLILDLDPFPANATGGEGGVQVVTVRGQKLAIKIFREPHKYHRRERVEAWIARPGSLLPRHDGSTAWSLPLELVLDPNGDFLGYVMLAAETPGDLVDFIDRSSPHRWPLRRALIFASEVLGAYSKLESHPFRTIICDCSVSNVLVDSKGRPVIIDNDSHQITKFVHGRPTVLPSPAHRKEYLPREIHGMDLSTFERNGTHHNFGIAVLLFQILLGNIHPFMCIPGGHAPARIQQGAFPYVARARYAPPTGGLDEWNRLPAGLQGVLVAAFVDGHVDPKRRPSIADLKAEVDRAIANPAPNPKPLVSAPKPKPAANPTAANAAPVAPQPAANPTPPKPQPAPQAPPRPAPAAPQPVRQAPVAAVQPGQPQPQPAAQVVVTIRLPALVVPRWAKRKVPYAAAAAAAVVLSTFFGPSIYRAVIRPRVAHESKEIAAIRQSAGRSYPAPDGAPYQEELIPRFETHSRAWAPPPRPLRPARPYLPPPGWPADRDPPEIERLRSMKSSSSPDHHLQLRRRHR
jgi:hypothetical protein